MSSEKEMSPFNLTGKKGLVVGIANENSIAYGCAKVMHSLGAEIAATYLNEKAKQYVEPLTKAMDVQILEPCDLRLEGQLENVFARIEKEWGKLDFLVHSVAYATKDDLHGRVVDCSREGFRDAMDVSVHSLIYMSKLAEPLMKDGGSIMTMSFYGSQKVVKNYNMMGPVKAALESTVLYLADELGPKGINVNTISPGPLATRAASGINNFDEMMKNATERAPLRRLVTIDEIGSIAAYLASDLGRAMTGETLYMDCGYNIVH